MAFISIAAILFVSLAGNCVDSLLLTREVPSMSAPRASKLEVDELESHLISLYKKHGYNIVQSGQPGLTMKGFHTGGGCLPSDLELILDMRARIRPQPQTIFAVGNAFGFS